MSDSIAGEPATAFDPGLSKARLVVLRALYALIALGLAAFVWPPFLASLPVPAHYHGVTMTMLAAFSILCAVGIRYPLQMLPLLLWELLWKSMWLLLVALPRWRAGTMDAATTQTAYDCATIALLLLALPWGHVVRNSVRRPAERTGRAGSAARL